MSENICFTKGLQQIAPIHRKAFDRKIMKILEVTTQASLSRHSNGLVRTSEAKQIKIGNAFLKMGVVNWRGKKQKS